MTDLKASFTGSIPEYYDTCLGPAWFDAYAADLAQRLPARPPGDVLEIACGTGQATRRIRERLDPDVRLVATDLNKAMLDYARSRLGDRKDIEWREADAVNLPFGDGEFGAVVCAFGVMFVPDKMAMFREVRRVLREGGVFLFNVWDRIEENPCPAVNAAVVEGLFPGDQEMRFRIPYEMHDPALLRQFLAGARFQDARIEKKRVQIDGVSARTVATGLILGTPRSLMIEKRGVPLDGVVDKVTAALSKIGGADPFRASAQAVVVEARAIA
ncbi:MAG: class I SAM-dependent methyltransferase [Pseudomonadota bacterium]